MGRRRHLLSAKIYSTAMSEYEILDVRILFWPLLLGRLTLMILGIGNDLCDVERMAGVIQRGRTTLPRPDVHASGASPRPAPIGTVLVLCGSVRCEGGIREGARHRDHRAGTLDGHRDFSPLDRVNQSRQFRAERSHDCGGLRTVGATRWSTSRSRTMLDLLLRLLFSKHAIDQVGTRSGLIAATGDGCGDSAHIGCHVSPTTARHSTP